MTMIDLLKSAYDNLSYSDDEGDLLIENIYYKIIELHSVSRIEGILGLEEKLSELVERDNTITGKNVSVGLDSGYTCYELTGLNRLIVFMIECIINGMEPVIIERIGMQRCISGLYKGYEAIAACMIVNGAILIQDGVNSEVMVKTLLSMMPDGLEIKICRDNYNRA